jgi:hypothetical protein
MDPIRRTILATGAAATAVAAAPRVFAQQTRQDAVVVSFYGKRRCSHSLRGGRFRLPAFAHCRRSIEFDDLRPHPQFAV